MLGYPNAALADAEHALKDAHEIDHAATSMFALSHTSLAFIHSGKHETASALINDFFVQEEEIRFGVLLRIAGLTRDKCRVLFCQRDKPS